VSREMREEMGKGVSGVHPTHCSILSFFALPNNNEEVMPLVFGSPVNETGKRP